ncbi:MAG: tryptophanase leader peptide [Aliivibrio sp.]|nr:tryptophanase leader peptide [Aliivibrio sp.]
MHHYTVSKSEPTLSAWYNLDHRISFLLSSE